MFTHGLVTRRDGTRLWVELNEKEVPCILRGRLKKKPVSASSPVVIGDEVSVQLFHDGTEVIESVRPRRSELARPSSQGPQIIAANLDQVVIVQAARQPAFNRRLTERFLATAQRGRMGALLVVNKCDLEPEEIIRAWVAPLAPTGVSVLLTSTVEPRGIDELRALLTDRSSVLAGQSGGGKSSLLNAMYPNFTARIGAVSDSTQKGRHTTTASRLYALPGGGYLADTPGIRTLALFRDEDAVDHVFPEIVAAAERCKFHDCTHRHEPDCAVRAAVDGGEIDSDRYRNYVRLAHKG